MFQRTYLAGPAPAEEHWHKQVKRIVTVARKNKRRETGLRDLDAEFLAKLTDQAGFRGLAVLDVAKELVARKVEAAPHDTREAAVGQQEVVLLAGLAAKAQANAQQAAQNAELRKYMQDQLDLWNKFDDIGRDF